MGLDPEYAIRQLQRGINQYHGRYTWLRWPHVPVDGKYGSVTDRLSKGTQAALGISPDSIGKWPLQAFIGGKVLIRGGMVDFGKGWFFDPQAFWEHHPGGVIRHEAFKRRYLANLKAQDQVKPGAHGLKVFDGFIMAPRVADHLQWFREHGWVGGVIEQLGACRTKADQIMLRETNNMGQGGIVGLPGTSEHECYRFYTSAGVFPSNLERGAADVTRYDQARQISDRLGSTLKNNIAGDPVHFDFVH